MLKQKNLISLAIATLAVVVIALAVQHSRKPVSDFSEQAAPLVAGLADHLNDVSRLLVTTANKNTVVTLVKKDGVWTVAEKGGYPADLGKLREYLLKLAESKLVEKKTARQSATRISVFPTSAIRRPRGSQSALMALLRRSRSLPVSTTRRVAAPMCAEVARSRAGWLAEISSPTRSRPTGCARIWRTSLPSASPR